MDAWGLWRSRKGRIGVRYVEFPSIWFFGSLDGECLGGVDKPDEVVKRGQK